MTGHRYEVPMVVSTENCCPPGPSIARREIEPFAARFSLLREDRAAGAGQMVVMPERHTVAEQSLSLPYQHGEEIFNWI